MTLEDMQRYRPQWHEPWRIGYREFAVLSSSGRAFGGLWSLLALKTLEHTRIAPLGHFSSSAAALELMVRTARHTLAESWIFDYHQMDRPEVVRSRLTRQYSRQIWERVRSGMRAHGEAPPGSHSYQIIVVDRDGNVVTGTNTHESLAWGNGVFVEGIPLNTAGRIPWATVPGERQISPFSIHLVFEKGKLRAATGAFSSSLLEASFQFLVNLMDYRLPAQEAVTQPRFGTFPYQLTAALTSSIATRLQDDSPNWLDPRVAPDIVRALALRGLEFVRKQPPSMGGWVDTGLGAAVTISESGEARGAVTPWVEMAAPPGTVQTVRY
jgi:gamma-glutamyltranspeptidase